MHLSLIDRLQELLRSGGEDQQGILFGKPSDDGPEVVSSRGLPVFDSDVMAKAIANAGDKPIGYYRVRDGHSLELTTEEIAIADKLFSTPGSVVLLIERRRDVPAEGCFFFPEGGALLNYPLLRFPVDSAELSRREAQRLKRAEPQETAPPADVPAPGYSRRPSPPRSEDVSPDRPHAPLPWRRIALIVGGAAAGFIAFLLVDLEHRRGTPAAPAPAVSQSIGTPLKAERQGADLKISWDLGSPVIASATSGMLSINDGGAQRQLPLTAEQVRFGGVLYSPTSDHISIRLTTLNDNRSTSEASVLVLLNRDASRPGGTGGDILRADNRQTTAQGSASRNETKGGTPAGPPAAPASGNAGTFSPLPAEDRNPPKASASASPRPFVPPASEARRTPSTAPQELPTIHASAAHLDLPVLPGGSVPQPSAPSAAAPRPPERAKNAKEPTPPVLIYEPGVTVPPELRQVIGGPVSVRVRVTVDATGRVTHAEALREGRVHALLLTASTNAALRCRFRPARLGDTPVAMEVTLRFQVRP